MAEYIADWEKKWKIITEEQDKKGRAQAYRYHYFLQLLSPPVRSLADNHTRLVEALKASNAPRPRNGGS